MFNKIKSINYFKLAEIILNIIFLFITLAGVGVSIYMNLVNLSLWLDEAMLAYSFSKRSLLELTSAPLEWMQSAPVGWLYLLKIVTLIFGNTEIVLRSVSIFGFILTLFLSYFISRKYLNFRYPLAGCAFLASMEIMLQYSNIFKPYITDCAFVLLVFIIFKMYEEHRINLALLCILWSALIWFSNPVCFFEGGLLIASFFLNLLENKTPVKSLIKTHLILLSCILVSFIIYYFYWLRPVAALGSDMQAYWDGQQFPLIPTSISDLKLAKRLINAIINPLSTYKTVIFISVVMGLFISISKRSTLVIGLYLGILVSLFASFISMYPISPRLWLFIYPVLILLFLYSIKHLMNDNVHILAVGLIVVILCLQNNGLEKYSIEENIYWNNEETRQQVEWLNSNLSENDSVYVFYSTVPGLLYANNYNESTIGQTNKLYLGTTFFNYDYNYHTDLAFIENSDTCYIVLSHYNNERITEMINSLHHSGSLELIYNDYSTPIYHYYSDAADSLSNYEIEIFTDERHNTIRIRNTGATILNHDYENMYLMYNEMPYALPKLMSPGSYVDITLPGNCILDSGNLSVVSSELYL